jgi:hypothetical protein
MAWHILCTIHTPYLWSGGYTMNAFIAMLGFVMAIPVLIMALVFFSMGLYGEMAIMLAWELVMVGIYLALK